MNTKLNRYYDVQEMYDDITYQIKEGVQQEIDNSNKRENAIQIIKDLFPEVQASEILDEIEKSMETFQAIAHQYKVDIETGCIYKDILLLAMSQILTQLKPYEIILHYMYPHMTHFFHSLHIWYQDNLTDCSADAKA